MNKLLLWIAISGVVFITACNNDTLVGSGLLSEEELNVEYIDTVSITARTVTVDSSLVFVAGNTATTTFPLGRLEDPYFGIVETEVIATVGVSGNGFLPNFENVTAADIDSCIMVLRVDTLGFYGDPTAVFDFEVFRLTENISEVDTFYSDVEYSRDMISVGSLNGYDPSMALDTIYIQEFTDSVVRSGTVRIPIDLSIAAEIVNEVKMSEIDSTIIVNDTLITNLINGFVIQATPSGSAMMGLDLSPIAYTSDLSELAIYYPQDTLDNRKYGLSLGLLKNLHIEHDYSGSVVEEAVNGGTTFGDSLLFVESLAGTNIEFDLSNVQNIQNRLLNYAELELVVAELMDYSQEEHPPIQILLASTDEDNQLILIEDISAIGFPLDVEEITDGLDTYWKYTIPLTRYVQDVIKSVESGDNLTISAILKAQRPNRSIIFGPNHSTFPSKLKLTFTNP